MRLVCGILVAVFALPVWADEISVVQSNNIFGFKLMSETLKKEAKPRNVLLSPISAHQPLSMVVNGATGVTRDHLLDVLGYNKTDLLDQINSQNQQVLGTLSQAPLTVAEKSALSPREPLPPLLSIQNSAWTTNGATDGHPYQFKADFSKTLKASYEVAHISSLDFKNSKSADVINAWTKNATDGMIPTIIDSQTLSQLLWVLLNTTLLEAQWEHSFSLPSPGDFALSSGEKIKVPMMYRVGESRFLQNSDVQVAEISIVKSSLKAYVVLPQKAENFMALQQDGSGIWSDLFWKNILSHLDQSFGSLRMPKFDFEYGVTLLRDQPLTTALDLNFLFQSTADLSAMDGVGSPASQVGIIKQNNKIEWNENGVKAAAATFVGGMSKSLAPQTMVEMNVDRPFYFAIEDSATGAFLFLGQVVDPR